MQHAPPFLFFVHSTISDFSSHNYFLTRPQLLIR